MKIIALTYFFYLALASCSGDLQNPEVTGADLELQLNEIKRIAESGECSENTQCFYLPYGSKPCGGPRGFVIFSSTIDVETLKAKIEKYTKAEEAYNKNQGIISDCMLETPPQNIGCLEGKCTNLE